MTINSILSLCWTTNYNFTGEWLRAEVPCCTCQSRHNSASSLYLALPEKSRRNKIFCICLENHIIGVYKILLFLPFLQRQTFVQGKHYLFLEVTSQLHRQLVPLQVLICLPRTLNILAILNWYQLYGYLQPWLMYLLAASDEQGPASIPNKVWSKWFFWFATRGLGIIHFGPCAKWPSAGSWSFSDSSLHGCQGENFHEGPKTLEGSLLQTSPINKVRVLTVELFHSYKIGPNYYFFCQGMERHQVQIKWKPAEVFVPYVRMPTRYHIEIITW